jgi:hypothetical protein
VSFVTAFVFVVMNLLRSPWRDRLDAGFAGMTGQAPDFGLV